MPGRRRAGRIVQLRKERNRSSRSKGPKCSYREERCSSRLNDQARPAAVRSMFIRFSGYDPARRSRSRLVARPILICFKRTGLHPVPAYLRDLSTGTVLCEDSRPHHTHGCGAFPLRAARTSLPSGCAAFTSARRPLAKRLSLSLTFRFFPVQSGRCSTVGTRAGPVAHHQPPRRHTGFSALPFRFAVSAARSASRERSPPSESPRDFRVVFACASPSPCFRFCSLFFSALPACQTDLARPRRC